MLKGARDQFLARWFVCRITSGRKSAQYGIRFSYPVFISLAALGIFWENPFIVAITLLIAFFGVVLPMHPFDYLYNYGIAKLMGAERIPGRGSELQVNSFMALLFNLGVLALLLYGIQLNYGLLAFLYIISSAFFIAVQLSTDNFSFYALNDLLRRKNKD